MQYMMGVIYVLHTVSLADPTSWWQLELFAAFEVFAEVQFNTILIFLNMV